MNRSILRMPKLCPRMRHRRSDGTTSRPHHSLRRVPLFTGTFLLLLLSTSSMAAAFGVSTAPILGLGAFLLRPGAKTAPSQGDEEKLAQAADFFTDAFWTNKVGGGAKSLSDRQRKSLYQSQLTEFRRRYGRRIGNIGTDRRSELLLCTRGTTCMGVVGIEVDRIPTTDLQSSGTMATAPLMSNLAVGRKFRRRGIAEELVTQTEVMVRNQWGYDECYLYVEKRNTPAIRLYRKLGYRKVWEDPKATTLLPTQKGNMKNASTTIVCMRKRLRQGIFGRLFS